MCNMGYKPRILNRMRIEEIYGTTSQPDAAERRTSRSSVALGNGCP